MYDAAEGGRASEVSSLLRDHPEINVNHSNDTLQRTALHIASLNGREEVVKRLLAHPDINVNVRDRGGLTPISFGCYYGQVSVVRELLKDPRVDITLEDNDGCTPLWNASCNGYYEVIEWLIASGRDLGNIKNKIGKYGDGKDYTALEIARSRGGTEVVSLLERFMANPTLTRHELRVKLRFPDELAAEVFALTVFLCDDLLQLKPASGPADAAATRFFTIASKLPMELQMILCHRAVGSLKQNILHKDSEISFKSLARILLVIK